MTTPVISLIFATRGRPQKALECRALWMKLAIDPDRIEVVTVLDADDQASIDALPGAVIIHPGGGCVAAWNEGAKRSTGQILVQLSDDWVPPQDWDEIILDRIGDFNKPRVLSISDGHRGDRLLCMAIMTRARYTEQGYMFHPRFKSVYSDDFFTAMAYRSAVTVIEARDVVFEHQHPGHGYGKVDAVTAASNSRERYATGKQAVDLLMDGISIGFTVWNRPDCLSKSLDSWAENDFSMIGAVHFFVEPSEERENVLAVIDRFAGKITCPVVVHLNPEKYGVLKNPWIVFDNLFRVQGCGFVILAEDDFVVSNDATRWLAWSAAKFKESEHILAACCKNHAHKSHAPDEACITPAFGGNIWGTWWHQWERFLRDTWDFDYSSGKKGPGKETPSGWDWNIGTRIMPQNKLSCVMPVNSRSYHIGRSGVHTVPHHYEMTVVTNFISGVPKDIEYKLVDVPSDVNYATYAPVGNKFSSSGINITTAGDIGDIIYLLAVIRSIPGGPHTLLLRDSGGTRGILSRAASIDSIVRAQPCIADVRPWTPNDVVHWPSEKFRLKYKVGGVITLLEAHANHAKAAGVIGFVEMGHTKWLTGIGKSLASHGRVVINRTDRYLNHTFPWEKIVQHYGDRLLFVGTVGEHRDFCKEFGMVERIDTATVMDLATVIHGSELFIGNQSCSFAIAEGLKHPAILEVCATQPDCIFLRDNLQCVHNGDVLLPDVQGSGTLKLEPISLGMPMLSTQASPPHGWQYGGKVMGIGFNGAVNRMLKLPQFINKERSVVESILIEYNALREPDFFARQVPDLSVTVRAAIRHAEAQKKNRHETSA